MVTTGDLRAARARPLGHSPAHASSPALRYQFVLPGAEGNHAEKLLQDRSYFHEIMEYNGIQDNRMLVNNLIWCVCVCVENGVYPLPLPVIEHNYWTWIKMSLIYLLTKKVIFRGYLGHMSQLTVVIHPPVWTAPSNSLNQFTQILLMADVHNFSPVWTEKMWVKRIPCLAWVIPNSNDGHFSFLSPRSNESPVWWVSPIWTIDTPPKNGKPRLKRQGSPKRCRTCFCSASSRTCTP